jgi:hypothetical protein
VCDDEKTSCASTNPTIALNTAWLRSPGFAVKRWVPVVPGHSSADNFRTTHSYILV